MKLHRLILLPVVLLWAVGPAAGSSVSRGGRTGTSVPAGNQPLSGLPSIAPVEGLSLNGAATSLAPTLAAPITALTVESRVGLIQDFRKHAGLAPLEPAAAAREVVDANLVSAERPPEWLAQALRSGLRLPPRAVVTAPDGRRFYNRLVLEGLRRAGG